MTQYSHLGFFGYVGYPWPIYFPWVLLALFLVLHSHGFLLTPLDFPAQLPYPLFLGLMDFPSTPYFPYFHYFKPAVAHSHFSTSHTVYGFASSLFPGSFRLVYFLKAHLFISWACNPLFLPLEFNGFSIHLLTLFYPCC